METVLHVMLDTPLITDSVLTLLKLKPQEDATSGTGPTKPAANAQSTGSLIQMEIACLYLMIAAPMMIKVPAPAVTGDMTWLTN